MKVTSEGACCELEYLCDDNIKGPDMFNMDAANHGNLQRTNCFASRGNGVCCFICEAKGVEKCMCCPNICVKGHVHECCVDGRCAIPCDADVPFAIACCG